MKNTCLNFTSVFKRLAISFLVLVLFLSFHQNSFSATGIPRTINFQGKLVNNPTATNVSDTSYTVIFSLYDKASGGTTLWTETQTVTTTDGIFRVALGSVTPIPSNFNFNWDGLYLGIKVNSDAEMAPRVQMSSVPFAFNSQQVAGLTVQDSAGSTGSTSATLKIGTSTTNPITVDLGVNTLTFSSGVYNASTALTINTTNGVSTSITLPTSGTLLTNTATANQTVTSTQVSGNVLSISDTSGTGTLAGLSFSLNGSGTTYDILGTGSTWSVTKAGVLTVVSCSGCTAGGINYWNLVSGNGVTNGGYLAAINDTVDLLLGGQSTSSAAFRVTGQGNPFRGTLVGASVSANTTFAAFVIDQKGLGDIFAASTSGVVKFRLSNGGDASTSGNLYTFGGLTPTIQSTANRTLTLGGNLTGNIVLSPNNSSGGFVIVNGNIAQIGTTTFSTGTGAISLNGDTTVISGKGLTLGGMTTNNNQVLFAANSTGLVTSVGTTTTTNLCLLSGSSIPAWGNCINGLSIDVFWNQALGSLFSNNSTIDTLLGGQSTPAAAFRVTGQGSPFARTQVAASISANTTFAGFVVDQKGTGDILTASTSGVPRFSVTNTGGIKLGEVLGTNAQCLLGGTTASWGSCGGGGSLFTDAGTFSYLTATTDDLILGASTVAAASFFMDVSAGALYLGTNNTGSGGINGLLTLYSSGNGIADPTIAVDVSGNLTLSAPQSGASVIVGSGTGNIVIDPGASLVGFGTSAPVAMFHFTRALSNGATGKSLVVFDQTENQDIFTASASGVPVFTLTRAGGIGFGGGPGSIPNVGTGSQCLLGGATAAWGACGTGGGGPASAFVVNSNGSITSINNTADFLIGGNSTGSADFVFGNLNGVGVPTASFSGNLNINSRPNSSLTQQQTFTKISGTAGTIGGGTAGVASVSASAIYNGSLYVGTSNPTNPNGSAEVYRYNGSTLGTWTSVSAAAGTIGGNTTTGIASASAMAVFDGQLYVGTSKQNAAEIYRYTGGTTWTKVSNATAGTIGTASPTTLIDGITSMAVFNGRLYAGTKEGLKAELYRYDGGTTWSIVNTTAGTFVTTNSVGVDAITSMVTKDGALYLGTAKANNAADVLRYNGGVGASVFTKMNNNTSGTFTLANGTTITAESEVTAMTVYNGNIIVGLRKLNSTEILALSDSAGGTTGDFWTRLNSSSGTINSGGTANIDGIGALTFYNGRLYAGTMEPSNAEVYRYETTGSWTRISNIPGAMSGAAGSTTGISTVNILQPNSVLFIMTSKYSNAAEVYSYEAYLDQSYSLTFTANPGLSGGVQNGNLDQGSIFFLASSSAIANNKGATNGEFVFSNSIVTRNGAYDVAEDYPTRDDTLSPGDLISIDTNERGFVTKSKGIGDSAVIGVYSENPALELSQGDGAFDTAKVVPVALAGRVPLKVSTENGNIKNGDYLTASSIPGVAMRATKSGVVIGQAMAPYDSEGIGKISVYVKSSSYDGTTADLFANLNTSSDTFDQDVLTRLANGQKQDGLVSEINTDRLVAGLEVISPKIVTDLLIAKTIRADQIEGLELLVGKIKNLDSINNSSTSTKSAVLGDSIKPLDAVSLTLVDSSGLATVSADFNVKGNSILEGMLTVLKSIATPNLLVSDFANFFGDVVFKKNISVEGTATFNSDTAGFAVINKGSNTVTVEFDNEYSNIPVITASIALDKSEDAVADKKLEDAILNGNITYVITQRTTKGFVIKLNQTATSDINFSWVALSIRNAKTHSSNDNKVSVDVNPEATKSAAFQSILNQLNSSNSNQTGGGG